MASKATTQGIFKKLIVTLFILVATSAIFYTSYALYTYKYKFKLTQNDYGKGYFEVKNTNISKEVLWLLSKRVSLPSGSNKIFYLNKDTSPKGGKYTSMMGAKKGDYLIAYKDTGVVFIFRPTENKLINVAPYQNDLNKRVGCSTWCIKFDEY